jgi:predicted TIM-barrel enzyme
VASSAADGAFVTAYKMSEKDSERRLLGSLSVERARQYSVTVATGGIRFVPRHRETVFATGVLGRRNDEVREYNVPLTEATLDTLKDMRHEVCAGTAPEAKSNPETEQYIIDRCKAGDDRACKLLRLR